MINTKESWLVEDTFWLIEKNDELLCYLALLSGKARSALNIF